MPHAVRRLVPAALLLAVGALVVALQVARPAHVPSADRSELVVDQQRAPAGPVGASDQPPSTPESTGVGTDQRSSTPESSAGHTSGPPAPAAEATPDTIGAASGRPSAALDTAGDAAGPTDDAPVVLEATVPIELRVTATEQVSQVTGAGSVNDTAARWNVHGTDLGHPIEHGGALYLVFGDTWGADGVEGDQWRSNVMARVADPDPRNGLRFESMIASGGTASELLPSRKVGGEEKTVIPTNGTSLNGRMFLHYMSVRTWDGAGRWTLNHAGLAYSDDDGRSWIKDPRARWPGHSNFGQVAFVHHGEHVYLFGIPGGRFGAAVLGRVPRAAGPLDIGAYEYWDGNAWRADAAAARPVVPGPVGELSVRWSAEHDRWLMMYLDEHRQAIVLRTAAALTGPWDEPRVVTTAAEHPRLYAPYLLPGSGAGADLYFTMSKFGPYQVFLMRTRLEPVAG
ncbi:MAG TPA: DUF4185 domain-containing protein [Nitriliruptorales bacterium]